MFAAFDWLTWPEVKDHTIRAALSPYGEVKEVLEDTWSKAYRYKVYNGVRIAVTNLKKHLPSHMIIVGTRVLISYEGQPPTCYGCNEQGHLNQDFQAWWLAEQGTSFNFTSVLYLYRLTTGWTARDRIPVGTRFSAHLDRPWGPPSHLENGYRVFPGGKVRPGRAADHSPPSSAAVVEE